MAETVHVTGFPADAEPHVTVTIMGWPVTVTEAEPWPVAPDVSVAVAVTVSEPLAEYVVVKLAPDPVDGLPPGADHVNVNELVPPVAEALQVTGLPAVAVPHVTVTVIVTPPIATVWGAVADTPLASFAVTTTVKVPEDV